MTHNVDPAEIDKFSAMAANWWDPEGEFKPLHKLNPVRLHYIISHAGALNGRTALDVGCGGGILSESMALKGASVTGIDMGEAPLEVARLHGLESGVDVDYRRIPAEALAQEQPAQYDLLTCMEMLEHVPEPASVVNACFELVKPGGWIFFSTINRTKRAYLAMIIGAEKVLKWLPEGTHDHAKFIKPSELLGWCDNTGLRTHDIKGMFYNPLTDNFDLCRDVAVNYIVACQKPETN